MPLVIVGAGGHGREALDVVEAVNSLDPTYKVLGFVDDGRTPGSIVTSTGLTVLGGVGTCAEIDAGVLVAVGLTGPRHAVAGKLADLGCELVSVRHPASTIGSHVEVGAGLLMAAGARLTHAVTLGEHVHLNVNASVSHDCVLGSYVTITPGAHLSGNVRVGDQVWFGIGAVATQGVSIGAGATVGAGAVVIDDLPPGCTAVGVPARPLP